MSIDFNRCNMAVGRIHMEVARLLCAERGIRTAEGMLSDVLTPSDFDRTTLKENMPVELVVYTFYKRLEIAIKQCGHHLGMHLALVKSLEAANRSTGFKPEAEPVPTITDPEALRKKDLDRYRLLDCADVAYILGLSQRRVKVYVRRGSIKSVDLGHGGLRFRPADVDRFISKLAGDRLSNW